MSALVCRRGVASPRDRVSPQKGSAEATGSAAGEGFPHHPFPDHGPVGSNLLAIDFQLSCLIIDEIQRAPDLLLAIKKTVDEDYRPGRFLLTGRQQAPGARPAGP
jgi:hypothetical protein